MEEEKDRVVNTDRKIEEQSYKREPHERDESPDGQGVKPRGVIKQAAEDVQQGLVDTENYERQKSQVDLDQAFSRDTSADAQANPLPDRNRDMRRHDSAVPVDKDQNR
jgi:hypothetical protein